MSGVPPNPKIYHITHLDNLAQILEAGMLLSDARRLQLGLDTEIVGMAAIKRRRLEGLQVKCHPGTLVGQYVPFYFCPRSVMLYMLHMANHPELSYRGGQRPILHLQADMMAAIRWAEANGVRWAFSNRNAGRYRTDFFDDLDDLDKINWEAVGTDCWMGPGPKKGKQAEFLVYESFPWKLIERLGVIDGRMEQRVGEVLRDASHKPLLAVEQGWYCPVEGSER